MDLISKARGLGLLIKNVGLRGTADYAQFLFRKHLLREQGLFQMHPKLAAYPLWGRFQSSDMHVFKQIFQMHEYACLRGVTSPRLILDLGANVGYSSAYFLTCFPTAKVLAVEPDQANYELCCRNLAPYGNRVQVIHGAVWPSRSKLALINGGDGREWGRSVTIPTQEQEFSHLIDGWDVMNLMAVVQEDFADIVKIDIEGSERELFCTDAALWVERVRNLCIELHGPDCAREFFKVMDGFDYDRLDSWELTVCRNIRPNRQQEVDSAAIPN